jgi:IS30 family transposase
MRRLQRVSLSAIARELGRDKSTISRELLRNKSVNNFYSPINAEKMARKRQLEREVKLERHEVLRNYVVGKLKIGWSPETIAGRLQYEQAKISISAEAIYQFVYSHEGQRIGLYKCLVRKHAKRKIKCGRKANKRSTIPELISITQRPEYINQRVDIGHFENDLVFCNGSRSANIVTGVERKTRFVLLSKAKSKHAAEVLKSIVSAVRKVPKENVKSFTFDRGTEFSNHVKLRTIFNAQTFFCDPHSPWQKGQIENTNGRLRYFLPHNKCIKNLSVERLQEIQNLMNNQPRKCLGYRTPNEAFFDELIQKNGGYCCV